jgi:ATP-dependent Lhr-like helicase
MLAQLEGYEAPAGQWEAELLPARVRDYAGAWLDDLCTAGRTTWTRLRPATTEWQQGEAAASLRTTPVVLLPRRSAALWARMAPAPGDDAALGSRAQRLADAPGQQHGASFFDEMRKARGCCKGRAGRRAGRAGGARPRAAATALPACAR